MDVEQMIQNNMGLAYKQLHKFQLINDPDAYSLALEALWKAAQTYDASKGVAFSTYASVCIYNALGMHLRSLKKQSFILLTYDDGITGNDDLDMALYESMLDTSGSPLDQCEQKELREVIIKAYHKVLNECPTEEARAAFEQWWTTNGTARQADLAKDLGVSQSWVSRMLSAARYKLRKELEDYLCEQ